MELKTIYSFARPWVAMLALCSVLMLMESIVALALPWLAGQFAGLLLTGAATAGKSLLLALLALLAVQALLRFLNSWLLGRTSESVLAGLRIRIYDHIQAMPLAYFHEQRRGNLLSLLTNDVGRLASYITGTLLSVLPQFLIVCGAVFLMLRIDLRLTLLVAALVPIFYILVKVIGRRLRPLSQEIQQAHADAVSIAEENLGMLPVIKSFTREGIESARYKGKISQLLHLNHQERFIYAALSPSVQFVAGAAMLLVLWGMGTMAQDRTPAQMVSFLLYAALLTRPVSSLADVYGQTRQVAGALQRLGGVLAEEPEPLASGMPPLPPIKGDIQLVDVSFAYPGREDVLVKVNLHINASETIALTGPNGAGKSTLAHLLMRLMAPSNGRILIDGHDISQVSLESVRSQIGFVPQHVMLVNASVQDNIAWGMPDASMSQVQAAARTAQAHDFITALPQGYDSLIGDQGIRLSGGQRQRIALARALLKNPPILILDEATAMFDPEGEKYFIADCVEKLATRTVILITHRPASLALADRVLQLEHGRIIEPTPGDSDAVISRVLRPAPAATA